MVAVQMGDKYFIHFPRVVGGMQQLMLRTLTAVKQPQPTAGRMLKIQQNRRHVS
ncbi:Uncharacterised protein [Enterobacter cloacae]|nr:Uncharacterised protein [Enterobacter cloacae]